MFTEAQNAAIVRTELDGVFFDRYDLENADALKSGYATAETGMLFKTIPISNSTYIFEQNLGPGLFTKNGTLITTSTTANAPIGELRTVPDANLRAANKEFVQAAMFVNGVTLTKQMFDDNEHGVWAEDIAQFAMMARASQNKNAFGWFNGAFTTSTLPNGSSAISASQSLVGGGTTSNLVSGALSPTTLNNAFVALYQQVNQAGVSQGNVGKYLVVPPALLKLATEITDSVLVSDSSNNAVNFWRSRQGYTVLSSNWLGAATGGSDTAWFLLAATHSVSRIVRQGIETFLRYWGYSNDLTYFYQANFREEVFQKSFSGIVGSTGL